MPFLDGRIDSHRDQDVRRALHALSATAERTGAAILIVRHLNKSGGSNPLYRGGGSIGIIGAARAGMLVAADPSDGARRILAMTKSNLAPQAPALAFRIVSDELRGVAVVKWEGPTSHKATDLLFDARHDDEKGALGETMAFLRMSLKTVPCLLGTCRAGPLRPTSRNGRYGGPGKPSVSNRAKRAHQLRESSVGFGSFPKMTTNPRRGRR